jgi:hypothetical protein
MARLKRVNPMLSVAQKYVNQHVPELKDVPLHGRSLDGPPDAPRYTVTAEECRADTCPYGVSHETAAAGKCPILECQLRHSLRLLLDQQGEVVEDMRSGIHWH